ncbi:MAG: 23S rRNA (adenine(2503)-C(2))-methyltransferase RlmN [Prevotellaceae bacterium]|jgi:23S rRNA (adenine2503-C2)-methyltransferase|nr:23S rRNA (adenine(2503)-C(2))-methyltransferase RlmN [Prevotellaceae bacterium]
MEKIPLSGKTPDELREIVTALHMPAFSAGQLAEWLYKKRVGTFDAMSNISAKHRAVLAERYETGRVAPLHVVTSRDGTCKYLFQTAHGLVETVYIPDKDRHSLCVSCQVGCKMNCHFCMTGKQGWTGNLSAAEILNQVYAVADIHPLTNIVFMGMGEPFDNTDEVLRALTVLTAEWGTAYSPRRITVSSVGIMSGLKRFLTESSCHLAISLHNPFPEERLAVMPVEKAFPVENIIKELRNYDFAHQRRLSFEYIVFDGKNDTQRHAAALVRLLKGLPCRVNLIRFHAVEGIELRSPAIEKMELFRDYLTHHGIISTIRRSRGEDIAAACGQLSSINNGTK